MKKIPPDEKVSRIFRAISTPARFRILTAIGKSEACVCHLETLLHMRQSYISQQLMEMRDAGLLDTRRDGRYIFYRLTKPQLLDILIDIGKLFEVPAKEMEVLLNTNPLPQCCCPRTASEFSSLIGATQSQPSSIRTIKRRCICSRTFIPPMSGSYSWVLRRVDIHATCHSTGALELPHIPKTMLVIGILFTVSKKPGPEGKSEFNGFADPRGARLQA